MASTARAGRPARRPAPTCAAFVVDTHVLGHRRVRPTRAGVIQRDGIGLELRRVLRRPQRELVSYGSSRSNDQGVHDHRGNAPEQQTPEWKTRCAARSGVEGTVNEFAHGHGIRRCRYRGHGKAHIQRVLTAIAVNNERLSGLPPTEEPPTPRRPTAFQNYLDQRQMPRPKSWRTLGT
ncbi:transposase [Streptomyces erythrochromogenes]|uniref:transposase n=1 Tax=Streptomyces erythrochromogenes TaxID=285574 RepID=UPI00343853CD